jgi:hypothetical protein
MCRLAGSQPAQLLDERALHLTYREQAEELKRAVREVFPAGESVLVES